MTECDIYNSADWYEFTEGDLREQNRDQMKRHLRNCPHCRELYRDVDHMEELLSEAYSSESYDVPDDTEQEILDTARQEAERRREAGSQQTENESPETRFALKEFVLGVSSAAAVLLLCYIVLMKRSPEANRAVQQENATPVEAHRPAKSTPSGRTSADTAESPNEVSHQKSPSASEPEETKTREAQSGKQESSDKPDDPSNDVKTNQDTSDETDEPSETVDPNQEPDAEPEPKTESRPLDSGETSELARRKVGDVNNDGNVNVVDSMLITKALMNEDRSINRKWMDVNQDGRVTPQDARHIMEQTMNKRVSVGQSQQKTY